MAITYSDLSRQEIAELDALLRYAHAKAVEAGAVLRAALSTPQPRVQAHFKIEDTSERSKRLIKILVDKYDALVNVLAGNCSLRIDGESTRAFVFLGPEATAYVWRFSPETVKLVKPEFWPSLPSTDNPAMLKQRRDTKARVLIHEIAHGFLGAVDLIYYQGSEVDYVTRDARNGCTTQEQREELKQREISMAMSNADSYAYFAIPVEAERGGMLVSPVWSDLIRVEGR